jgi:hypothetical protein
MTRTGIKMKKRWRSIDSLWVMYFYSISPFIFLKENDNKVWVMSWWCRDDVIKLIKRKGPQCNVYVNFSCICIVIFLKKLAVLHLSMTSRWCQQAIKGRHGWISRLACACMLGSWVWCPDCLNRKRTSPWTEYRACHGDANQGYRELAGM